MSRALVDLAERGLRADADAKKQPKSAYRNFIDETGAERKNEAGCDLIRAIFGKGRDCRRFNSLTFRAASGITCFKKWTNGVLQSMTCGFCRSGCELTLLLRTVTGARTLDLSSSAALESFPKQCLRRE